MCARISTYPRDTFVTGLDKWIGTDANTENLATKNFTANAVADYFNRSAIIDTGQFSWQFQPYSDTQPQAEMTFQQIDHLDQNINILALAAAPLRVSALTLANTMPKIFITNEWVDQAILIHVPSGPSQYAVYNVKSVTPDTQWFFLLELEFVSGVSATIHQGDPLVFGYFGAANTVTEVKATFPILVSGTTKPTISLDTTTKNNWNTAYNRSLVSASVTGTTTKTLTLTEQGGGTITTSWVDDNTDAVTSVFGRTGAVVAQSGDYTTTLVTEGTNLYFTDQRARNVISSSITGIGYSNTTGIFSLTTGYFIPTTTQSGTWDTAYNRSITSAAVTGTTTKTLTLNQQDGGTITASWTDLDTNLVTSVFGRTGAVVAQSGDYTTTQVTEGDNLYFTTARARGAISLTTTGTSGAATYSSATGILNIPQYQGGVTSFNTRTGAITLTSQDVTDALGFTPENVANKSNDTALGTSATLYPTQNAVKVYVDSATAGGIILQGDWNAATNVPDITGTTRTGFAWRVSVAGNTNLGGITDWLVGDLAVKSATGWIKIDNTESVTSVFGRFGTVVAQSGDYNTDLVTEGTTNLYFTTARARASISAGSGIAYNSTTGVISSTSGGGSVTSVGLSMPSAFTVTNSPVTSTGTLTVTGAGTTAQYIRGDGTLATLPGTSAEARSIVREVYNKTGATLTKGTVVYINSGQGNLPAVTKAIATGDMSSAQTFGVVQSDITDQNNGFVVVTGGLDNLDTQGLGVGTQLYLSSTIAGAYTTVKQYAPAHLVYVAIVVRDHPTQGVIEVNIQNGYELDELHNVSAQNPANNDIIAYNTTTSLWEKKSIATTLGYTPANAATTLTINGTGYDLSTNRTWSVGTVTSVGLTLGTTGTDANISNSPITSSGSITLNLPTASATNRGLLSNGDWTTFNSKQTALNGTGFVKMSGTTVSYVTGTSSQFVKADGTLDSNAYLPLSGGTLTGPLGGTSALFTSNVTIRPTSGYNAYFQTSGTAVRINYLNDALSANIGAAFRATDYSFQDSSGSAIFTLASSGAATFSNSVTSTLAYSNTSDLSFVASANIPGLNLRSSAGGRLSIVTGYIGADISSILVGTGTNNPSTEALRIAHSNGAASFTSSVDASVFRGNLQVGSATSGGQVLLNYGGNVASRSWRLVSDAYNFGDFSIQQSTTQTGTTYSDKLIISAAGNVGIGTTAPESFSGYLTTEVSAAQGGVIFAKSTTGSITAQLLSDNQNAGGAAVLVGARTNHPVVFTVNNTERMRITAAGEVGIGTSAPILTSTGRGNLTVNGSSNSIVVLGIAGANSGYLYATASVLELSSAVQPIAFSANGAERMRITSGGNVGIGTTSIGSGDKFKVAQSGVAWAIAIDHSYSTQFYADFRYNGTNTGSITGNGTTTSYNITSDYRLKEDLKPINGLEIVNKINVYDFKWKSSDNRMDGVMAHELAEVLPYAVTGVKDGEQMQQVDYSKIVPVMVQAIKDLKAKIETLENK